MENKKSLKDMIKEMYEDKSKYYLNKKTNVIVRLDGRAFTRFCNARFNKPFDENFIRIMNETARHLCRKVEGCKFGYVQSDKISLLITDYESEKNEAWFGYNIQKIASITASIASSKFNQLMSIEAIKSGVNIDEMKLIEFDSRVFSIDNQHDTFLYFVTRLNECVKNSKIMTAKAYIDHSDLIGKKTDEQIKMVKEFNGVDWNTFSDEKKYGRFLLRTHEKVEISNKLDEETNEKKYIIRNKWNVIDGFLISEKRFREFLKW